jgi:hypothetical protein
LAGARVLTSRVTITLIAACEECVFEDAGEEIDDAVDDAKDEIDRRN